MIIVKARSEQIDEIYALIENGRKHIATFNIDQWQNNDPSYESLVENIQENKLYILMDNDEILGCFVKMDYDDQYDYIEGSWLKDDEYVAIHRFCVKYFDRGLGSYLLQELKKIYPHIKIDTHVGNISMNKCLCKNGFSKRGTIYLHNNDARVAYEYLDEKIFK